MEARADTNLAEDASKRYVDFGGLHKDYVLSGLFLMCRKTISRPDHKQRYLQLRMNSIRIVKHSHRTSMFKSYIIRGFM